MTQVLNQEVDVTAYYFAGGKTRGFPKRVQYNGNELTFAENGLRCLVKKGQDLIEIFNMSDGRKQYRLRFEPNDRCWTLLTSSSVA